MLCHTRTVICVVPLPIATLLYTSFDASEASMNPIPTDPPQPPTPNPRERQHILSMKRISCSPSTTLSKSFCILRCVLAGSLLVRLDVYHSVNTRCCDEETGTSQLHLCRSYNSIFAIQDMFSYEMLISLISNELLPDQIRSAFCQLLLRVYIDRYRFQFPSVTHTHLKTCRLIRPLFPT